MSQSTSPSLPTEFYKVSTFFTLGGAAGAVWLFCLVVSSFNTDKSWEPVHFRIIALVLSEIIAMVMVWRNKSRRLEYWLIGFFNGLLIFVNASGINAVSTNLTFVSKDDLNKKNSFYNTKMDVNVAAIINFKNEINWWQNNKTYVEKKIITQENDSLKIAIDQCSQTVTKLSESPNNETLLLYQTKNTELQKMIISYLKQIEAKEENIKQQDIEYSKLLNTVELQKNQIFEQSKILSEKEALLRSGRTTELLLEIQRLKEKLAECRTSEGY